MEVIPKSKILLTLTALYDMADIAFVMEDANDVKGRVKGAAAKNIKVKITLPSDIHEIEI